MFIIKFFNAQPKELANFIIDAIGAMGVAKKIYHLLLEGDIGSQDLKPLVAQVTLTQGLKRVHLDMSLACNNTKYWQSC